MSITSNIVLSDLTGLAKNLASGPVIRTSVGYRTGNREAPDINVSFSGNNEGDIVTISAKNTANFGGIGPELVSFMDATKHTADNKLIPMAGPGTTFEGSALDVDDVPGLPGNKGIIVGATGSGDNNSDNVLLRAPVTTKHRRGFESSTFYWPETNQNNAKVLLDQLGTSATWQVKPVWNTSDQDVGGSDTDFFIRTQHIYFPSSGFTNSPTISSNSIPTKRFASNIQTRGNENDNMPLFEPYTTEFVYDQGTLAGTAITNGDGYATAHTYSRDYGVHQTKREDNLLMHVPNGPTKEINSFTYPGFVRGFNRPQGAHYYNAEFYKACGYGACCRVAICDDPDYFSAKNRTILIINSWNRTEIKAQLRGGWFDLTNLTGKYLAVIDRDDQQIASILL